jgi:alpha-D-xyloside xylohydrolase
MVWKDDNTIMRALVMDFPGDPSVIPVSDQYMFGPSLMVSPICRYRAREREILFPRCEGWYDLESGAFYEGGQTRVIAAPYEKIPIHARAGSIIPVGPGIQYVGEQPGAPVTLFVYAGADGMFTLYEDEGINYNYEQGACSEITFTYLESGRTLHFGERQGSFEGMVTEREFRVVLVDQEHPRPMDPSVQPDRKISYNGGEISVQL